MLARQACNWMSAAPLAVKLLLPSHISLTASAPALNTAWTCAELQAVKTRALDWELSVGELTSARDRAIAERARALERTARMEKENAEHRCEAAPQSLFVWASCCNDVCMRAV